MTWRPFRTLIAIGALLPAVAAAQTEFGQCVSTPDSMVTGVEKRSLYLTMRDGIRLAADVRLPTGNGTGPRFPTILVATPYWRGWEGSSVTQQEQWVHHGYAVVVVDVRGTGASFGRWSYLWSPEETQDMTEIVAWIAKQPWSNQRIGTVGGSYLGNTAQHAALARGRFVKLVIPQYFDWDAFGDMSNFGGLRHRQLGQVWGTFMVGLQANQPRRRLGASQGELKGVSPVDGDSGAAWLDAAVKGRADVPPISDVFRQINYRDERLAALGGRSADAFSTHRLASRLAATRVPIFAWAGWQDGATVNGTIARFRTLARVPQRVVIGPWSHGAFHDTSPYQPSDAEPWPTRSQQIAEVLCAFDAVLESKVPPTGREIIYYTLGEERWHRTTSWPLPGTRMTRWYLEKGQSLAAKPGSATSVDRKAVDFDAGTGPTNRWMTGVSGSDVIYPDRREADRRLLVYDSPPLESDLEITGQAVITLWARSTHEDGAFIGYFEDVEPDGTVRYLTEGALRAIHRVESPAPYPVLEPYHSLTRRSARPLVPGQWAKLRFGLVATSVLIKRGHRIRIAIAGHDKDAFDRVPTTGDPTIEIGLGGRRASFVEFPAIPRR